MKSSRLCWQLGALCAAGATLLGQYSALFPYSAKSLRLYGDCSLLIGLSVFTKQLWTVLLLITLLEALQLWWLSHTIKKETPPMRGKVFGLRTM